MSAVKQRENLVPHDLGWSDAVPESWLVMPCRAFVEEKTAKNENAENQNYLSLMANVGIIPYEEKGDVGNKKPEDLSKCKLVNKGDLVINSMNYGIGSYGLSALDGVCSSVYIVLKSKSDVVHERYALRIFESKSFQQYAQSFGTGILEHRAAIGWDDLKNIKVGIPTLKEQQWLLQYLDRETARIDALISRKTRFIELLREKRQALITHAVTKGLDPNVKLKDSGLEWLGEVPEHWGTKRLQFLCESIKAGPFGSALTKDMYVVEGYRVYGQEQVIPGDFSIGDYYITPEYYSELAQYAVQPGDVLVSCVGTFGKIAVVPEGVEPGIINPRLIRIRVNQLVSPAYLTMLMRSNVVFEQFSLWSRGGTMDVINIGTLSSIVLALPPASEQQVILRYVEHEAGRIDSLINRTERSIELLKERRSALITAAVTGQIDLREAA